MTAQATFTNRQVEVIRLAAAGFSADEIGARLGITGRTVRAHLDNVRRDLGVRHGRHVPLAYMKATGDDPFPRPGEEL